MSLLVNRRGIVFGVAAVALGLLGLQTWRGFAAREATPAVPAREPRAVSVVVAHPTLKPFAHEVEAVGTVRANESVNITAKVAERITAIHFEEGQYVRKGQLLVELDSAEARAELAAAEAELSESRGQFQRSQELYHTRALSEAQLEQVKANLLASEARVAAARARLEDRMIRAPFSGRVGLRNVSLGSLVSPGEVITTLDDLSSVKLDFAVPEVFLSVLEPGLPVTATSSAYPDETFAGRVASVGTRIDPATRSVTIRAVIRNPENRLRPGLFMTVKVVRSEREALMVPERAIVPESARHYVFVADEGVARKREVLVGRRRPGEVEILEGLSTGDLVIVDGTLKVHDGQPVRVNPGALVAELPT